MTPIFKRTVFVATTEPVATTQAVVETTVTDAPTTYSMTPEPTTQKPKSRCSAKAARLRENNMVPLNKQNLPDCVIVRMETL